MRAKQIRKIHISENDIWKWTTEGSSGVILFDKHNKNKRTILHCSIAPRFIKNWILVNRYGKNTEEYPVFD